MKAIQVVEGDRVREVPVPPAPGMLRVGSAPGCDVVIRDSAVDPEHLRVEETPGGIRVTDAGTRHGTRLNGIPVTEALLRPGDEVRLGGAVIRLAAAGVPPPPRPASPSPASPAAPRPSRPAAAPPGKKAAPAPRPPVKAAPRASLRPPRRRPPAFWVVAGAAAAALAVLLLLRSGETGRAEEAEASFRRAQEAWRADRIEEAEKAFREIIARWPDTPQAGRARAAVESILAARRREEEARRARKDLEGRWVQLTLEEYEKEYRTLLSKYSGTKAFADEAALERVRKRYREEGERRFAEVKARAARLVAEGRYFDAVQAWHEYLTVPGNVPPDIPAATEEFRRIHARAREAWEALGREADGLIAEKKYGEAAALLEKKLPEFRGTRYAFRLRQKLDLVAILEKGEEKRPEEAVARVARREEFLRAAENAESLAARRRYREAMEAFEKAASGCPHEDLAARFRARAKDLEDYAVLFDLLYRQIRESPGRFRGIDLGHGFRADAVAADPDHLTVEIRGARSELPWARLGPDRILVLLERLRLSPADRIRLARFAFEAGNDKAAQAAITSALKADEKLAPRAFAVIARARKIPVPEEGFVLHRGRWMTPLERDEAILAERIADAERDAKAKDPSRREKGFAALKELGEPARAAYVRALEAQRQAAVDQLLALPFVRDPAARRYLADEIGKRRKAALALIFDTKKYPYPHPPGAEYAAVQAEVDRLVEAVRVVWEKPIALLLEKDPRAYDLYSRAQDYSFELASLGHPPKVSFDDLVAKVNRALSLRGFPGGGVGKSDIEWNRKCLEYNRKVPIDADPEERACVDAVNEYRMMMGLRAVKWNAKLLACARGHSRHMRELNYFAHNVPFPDSKYDDIRTPSKRARKAGYGGGVSENIARGARTGREAFLQWYGSSGHHRNMLGRGHTEIGVGRDGDFWTQNFGHASTSLDLPREPKAGRKKK